MNHMIRDMGRGIVRLESRQQGQRSRLWNPKDSYEVLTEQSVRNILLLCMFNFLCIHLGYLSKYFTLKFL